ncbi:MAG: hypothetical protein ACREJB_05245 [Planctomycetaceae bacterium]
MNRTERYYALGRDAEARGSLGVAKLHYRLAVKHGSQLAQSRLDVLEQSSGVAVREEPMSSDQSR